MVAAVIVVFLLAGGGTVAASAGSLPDESLYPMKLATERIRLALPHSDIARARLHAKFADRRFFEIARMTEKGKPGEVEWLSDRMSGHLQRVGHSFKHRAKMTPGKRAQIAELRGLLQRNDARHEDEFQKLLKEAPPQARPALRYALKMKRMGYESALQSLGEEGT